MTELQIVGLIIGTGCFGVLIGCGIGYLSAFRDMEQDHRKMSERIQKL